MPQTASWTRRLAALLLDWVACSLVTYLIVGAEAYGRTGSPSGWLVIAIFWLEASVGTAFVGGSFGQLLTRVRVRLTDGQPLPLLVAMARQLLVCLVIPPLIFRPEDGRGLHDIWTGSAAYQPGTTAASAEG